MSSLCVLNETCRACLVGGENIKFIEIGEKARYFKEFLKINVDPDVSPKPLLCYECAYRIGCILSFSDKVIAANAILDKLYRIGLQNGKLINNDDIQIARYNLKFPVLSIHVTETLFNIKENDGNSNFEAWKNTSDEETLKEQKIDCDAIKKEIDYDCDNDDLFNNNSDEDVLKEIQEKLKTTPNQKQKQRKNLHLKSKLVKRKGLKKVEGGARVISVFLTRDESIEQMRMQLSLPKFIQADFKCELCCKGFCVEDIYKRHMKKHDQTSGDHCCDICKQYFVSQDELSKHELIHKKRFQCTKCSFMRTCYGVVADHYSDEHERNNMRDIQCNICGKTFMKQNTYRKHGCYQAKVKCKFCNKTMLKTSINKHVLDIHTEYKPFECTVCKQCFSTSQSLRMHKTMRHPDGMEYCTDCNLFFKNKAGLRNHLKMTLKHNKEEYLRQCPHCPVRLPYWKRISHIDREHRKGGFVCKECGVSYTTRTSLSRHSRMIHRKIERERKFVCETCGKGFTVRKTLESHMNIHSGARPYKCESCESTFAHPAALYTHNRLIHLKLKRNCDLKKAKSKTEDQKSADNIKDDVLI